jgi:hypothetical protein
MAISVEEVKAFIEDAKKARESWITWADRSWAEIKKRQRNNRLLSVTPNSAKRRAKYPAWYGIFKIRQPLLLSRVGIPICKDATQDGTDHIGASAAFFKERLAINLAKSFPFFDALSTARDDFLVTNFGILRAYYERDEVKQKVKERIIPQQMETGDVVFVDGSGNIVQSDDIGQDDEGYFLETDEVIDVENERVCLDQALYKEVFIDPDIKRFNRCERMAFELHYSVPQFKAVFGARAYAAIPKSDDPKEGVDEASPKRQTIKVFEYWDKYERKVLWLPELGNEFITPKAMQVPEEYSEGEQANGLYDLEHFFPVPDPILSNQSTDEFWPIPEFYQLVELIEDIHTIFSRMMALTKAIRARVLFDNNVEGLQEALAEATEGDAFGVPNLAQSLVNNGGSLDSVVQYIPVDKMVSALAQIYQALEQRLNTLYRLTGVSDLLQGLIADGTQRTFGERQMLEKYALNQHAEPQRKMQEFVRNCYELLCEMALKNFKDESLERYMAPATAPQAHQNNFQAALELLKDDRKRFRIELETDSTIALNEQYDKQMRVELVNTLTSAIEKVAGIATSSPALVAIELHALKFLVQGFRQGKMFQQEISQAIDQVIQQMQAAADQEPAPNPDLMRFEFEKQVKESELKLKEYEILSAERIETARFQLEQQVSAIKNQLEQMRLEAQTSDNIAQQQLAFEKVRSEITVAQTELAQRAQELEIEVAKLNDERARLAYESAASERLSMIDTDLKMAAQRLEEYRLQIEDSRAQMELQEKWATEQRLQQEAEMNKMFRQLELAQKSSETQNERLLAMAEARAMMAPPPPAPPPPPKGKKKIRVQRDADGNMVGIEVEGGEGYQVLRDQNGDIIGYEPSGSM